MRGTATAPAAPGLPTAGRPNHVRVLPGSVEEIDASPAGPQIGAFFDVDGTLIAGHAASVHLIERLRRGELTPNDAVRTALMELGYRLGQTEFEAVFALVGHTLKGRRRQELDEIGERTFRHEVSDRMYPEMRQIVGAHQRRGHTAVLTSSASSFEVEAIARYVGVDTVLCNRFVVDDGGLLTGEVEHPVLWGPELAYAVQRFAIEHGVDLRASYFYASGDEDLGLMHLMGNPRPTNPGARMASVAARRGWPVTRLTSRSAGGTLPRLRMVAGLVSLLPTASLAATVGIVTRSRRNMINVLSSWPRTVLALNDVKLNVVGKENLTAQRPAVFLFNHRTAYDGIMAGAVVGRDFTGVAKKELQSNPIIGTLGWLMDIAFVDRTNTTSAVAALKPVEAMAKKGLSIVIAPEGTRLDTTTVGPFKKGAFRLAMSAGLPVVPIVIRNADSVGGRNSPTLVPGTVDVAVLPPIPTAAWTHENLDERIHEVRQLYIDTLEHWPSAVAPR